MFCFDPSSEFTDSDVQYVKSLIPKIWYFEPEYLQFLYAYVNKNKKNTNLLFSNLSIKVLNELYTNGFFINKMVYLVPDESVVYCDTEEFSSDIELLLKTLETKKIKTPLQDVDLKIVDRYEMYDIPYRCSDTINNDIIYDIMLYIMKKYKKAKTLYINNIVVNISPIYGYHSILKWYYKMECDIPKEKNYLGCKVNHKIYGQGVVIDSYCSFDYDKIAVTDKAVTCLTISFNGIIKKIILEIVLENNIMNFYE
jgi:hypothetical protein